MTLPAYAAVIVYADDMPKPTFCTVAHNLVRYEADNLAKRLSKQYDLDAHVVLHRTRHECAAGACVSCGGMFEDIIRVAEPQGDGVSVVG
jgi:hypothetical protein